MARRRRKKQSDEELMVGLAMYTILGIYAKLKFHVSLPWPIILLPSVAMLGALLLLWTKRSKYRNAGINEIDRMSGEDFERTLQAYLRRIGWKVKTTPRTGDFGADLVGSDPKGVPVVIQAKRWKERVGVKGIQEVIGAKAYYNAQRVLIITNNYFTKNAWELGKKAGVEMWNRNKLTHELAKVNKPKGDTSINSQPS